MFKKNIVAAAAFGLSLAAANHAFANDTCKNVVIKLVNDTADEIKVKTFEYYDFDKDGWRTENMFGIDGHQILEHGKSWSWTRDLEKVGDDNTKFRVTYQHHIGGTKWGADKTVTTDKFKCPGQVPSEVSLNK